MHKRRVNELKLEFEVVARGPLLIKAGDDGGLDPTLPAMSFVRTRHPQTGQSTIYLPGASLKGVIRSHTERIIHTVLGEDPTLCCDPLDHNRSCGARVRQQKITDTAAQYKESCLACRIFGHTAQASHLYTVDAYPAQPLQTQVRQNVAIDRLSGGVAVGPFDMEVVTGGSFGTQLTLHNFELWQLGLLALTLRDLMEGRVRLGFAKSRGLGEVTVALRRLEIGYPGQFGDTVKFGEQLFGVAALASDLQTDYGYVADDELDYPESVDLAADSAAWGRPAVVFAGSEAIMPVLAAAVPAWAAYSAARQGGG